MQTTQTFLVLCFLFENPSSEKNMGRKTFYINQTDRAI